MTFIIFIGICAASTLFVYVFVPETKGRSIDEISSIMRAHGNKVSHAALDCCVHCVLCIDARDTVS